MISHAFLRKVHGRYTNHLFPRWNFPYYFIVTLLSVHFVILFSGMRYNARLILYAKDKNLTDLILLTGILEGCNNMLIHASLCV